MSTPEGKVKAKVKKRMKELPRVYPFWPVQTGLGATTLDSLWCVNGWFVSIETKAKGNKLTPRQLIVMQDIKNAGGLVYVVDDDASLEYAVNDIADKCYPSYSVQQIKDPNGITRISPLVLSRRG